MAQTIEDVNSRTLLQQFHELYKRQNETETNVENLDTKIDQETIDRQTADLSINSEIQALRDQIDSLGVLFTYKGEVATIQDLPLTDNVPGDVYYVDSDQSEYIWLEKSGVYQWEQFGPAIDLSEYAKQEDLEQLESEVDAMNTQVESNASNIVSLTNTKQDKLTAGTNITIDANNVISASGGTQNAVTLGTETQTFEGTKNIIIPLYNMLRIGNNTNNLCLVIDKPNDTNAGVSFYDRLGQFIGFRANPQNNLYIERKMRNQPYVNVFYLPEKSGTLALTSDIDAKVPDAPNTDGTYVLKCVVSNGVKTYQWAAETIVNSGN